MSLLVIPQLYDIVSSYRGVNNKRKSPTSTSDGRGHCYKRNSKFCVTVGTITRDESN